MTASARDSALDHGAGSPVVRTALVTGASRGIGFAVARRLAALGARVALVARGADALHAAAAEVGAGAFPVACDVSQPDAVQGAAERVATDFDGPPDVLVNNAGLFALQRLDETSPIDFARTLETNLVAPFLFTRAFLPGMRARRSGHVVTVGSIADRWAFPENAAYAASKFGARGMHEVLRAETRGTGVRATLVSPAAVDTSLWDAHDPDLRPGFTPRAEMLAADAVAAAILFAVTAPASVNVDELRLSRS
jgi:NADP-dependent 3-hydroxy acid dehydrogenase YdfG